MDKVIAMMFADLLIYFAGLLIMIVLLVPTSHDDDLASDAGDSEGSYPLMQSVFVEGSQFDY
jgi:poly-D-alanine transfer protein DltD